ncbi:MAG: hypothetical protein RL410_1360 [Actinomycetota bacterium]|jgi:teichoic acid transport system permease protein
MPLSREEAKALAVAHNLPAVNAYRSLKNYVRECIRLRHFTWHYSIGRTIVATIANNLGLFWDFINPVLLSITYYFTFGVLLGTKGDSSQFITFLIAGVFTWQLFSTTFTTASQSLMKGQDLAESLRLPRILLPISATIQATLRSIPSLLMLFPIAMLGGSRPTIWWLTVPFIFLLTALLSLALALFGALIIDSVRDAAQTVPLIIRVLMFMSGVFYDVEKRFSTLPDGIRIIAENNPAALVLKFTRTALSPNLHHVTKFNVIYVVSLTATLLIIGLLMYWRRDNRDN